MIPSCEYVLTVYYDGVFLCSIPPLDSIKEMRKIMGHFLNLKRDIIMPMKKGLFRYYSSS